MEALSIIKSKFPHKKFLLVTGSKKREIDYFSYNPLSNLSTLLNINNFFDCIITQDDVLEQKPSPEPYKKALRTQGKYKQKFYFRFVFFWFLVRYSRNFSKPIVMVAVKRRSRFCFDNILLFSDSH